MGLISSCFEGNQRYQARDDELFARRVVSASELKRPGKMQAPMERIIVTSQDTYSDGLIRATSTGNSIFDEVIVGSFNN